MATNEIAGITLAVDVSQVDKGTQSLQKFRQANEQAAKGIGEFVNMEQVARNNAKDLARSLNEQKASISSLEKAIDPTAAKFEKLQKAASDLDSAFQAGVIPDEKFFKLGEILESQSNKLAKSRAALTEEGRAAAESAKQKERAASAGNRFIQGLEKQANAATLTREEFLKLQAAQLGVSEDAAPLISKISTANQKLVEDLGKQSAAFQKSGLSVGQYKQAIRLLPAQITDITTSLAGGMPIWLIAIQQGGQIKDSFGGIGNTFRFALSYLNPFNVGVGLLAAGLGLLAVNVVKSRKELDELKASVEGSLGVTGESAGKLALEIQKIAEASKKTGEEITKSFISTKDGADQSLQKLLDLGFSYDEATRLVEKYKGSANFSNLNAEITAHQLKINGISSAWSEAAQSVKDYYEGTNISQANAALGGAIDPISEAIARAKVQQEDLNKAIIASNKEYAKNVAAVEKEYLATDRVAGARRSVQDAEKQLISVRAGGDEKAISQAQRIVEIRKRELEDAIKSENKRGKVSEKRVKEQKDLTISYETGVLALESQLRLLKETAGQQTTISSERKQLLQEQAKFAILEERQKSGSLRSDQAKLLLEKDKVLELAKQKAELGDQIALQERSNKLLDDNLKKTTQINNEASQIGVGAGLSDREKQRAKELDSLRSNQVNKGGSVDDVDFKALLDARKNYYAQEDALRDNWLAGAQSAFANWSEKATDSISIAGELTTAVFDGVTDQITNLVTTGETNFRDFTASILKMIAKIAAQLLIVKAIESTISSFGGTGGAIGSIGSTLGFASGGYTGDGGKYQAAGVVHKGEFVMNKEATQRIGVGNLYKLMRGYANGGVVGSSSAGYSGSAVGGGTNVNVSGITVNVNSGAGGADPKALESGVKVIVAEEISKSFQQGGRAYQFLRGYN